MLSTQLALILMSGCPSDHSSLLSIAINWEVAAVWKSYCPHVVYSPTITSKTKFSFLTYEKNVQGSDIKFLLLLVIYCFPYSLLPTSLTFLLSCSFLISPRIPSLLLIPSFASPSVNRSTDCTCARPFWPAVRPICCIPSYTQERNTLSDVQYEFLVSFISYSSLIAWE